MAKKLYRNTDEKMIFGVCSGIAEYFDIDPTLVRIGWLAAFFCAGSGLFAYFIAALVMPSKPFSGYIKD